MRKAFYERQRARHIRYPFCFALIRTEMQSFHSEGETGATWAILILRFTPPSDAFSLDVGHSYKTYINYTPAAIEYNYRKSECVILTFRSDMDYIATPPASHDEGYFTDEDEDGDHSQRGATDQRLIKWTPPNSNQRQFAITSDGTTLPFFTMSDGSLHQLSDDEHHTEDPDILTQSCIASFEEGFKAGVDAGVQAVGTDHLQNRSDTISGSGGATSALRSAMWGAAIAATLGESLPRGIAFLSRAMFEKGLNVAVSIITGDSSHEFTAHDNEDTSYLNLRRILMDKMTIGLQLQMKEEKKQLRGGTRSWQDLFWKRKTSCSSSDSE